MPNSQTQNGMDLGVIQQRVSTLENSVQSVSVKLDQIANALAEKNKTPWTLVLGFLSIFITISGAGYAFVFTPFGAKFVEMDLKINAINSNLVPRGELDGKLKDIKDLVSLLGVNQEKIRDTYVSEKAMETRLLAAGQKRDAGEAGMLDRIRRLEEQVADITKLIVPRGEHEEKWRGQGSKDADQQRQIDAVTNNFRDLYSPKDALASMQRRIDDLERMLRSVPLTNK